MASPAFMWAWVVMCWVRIKEETYFYVFFFSQRFRLSRSLRHHSSRRSLPFHRSIWLPFMYRESCMRLGWCRGSLPFCRNIWLPFMYLGTQGACGWDGEVGLNHSHGFTLMVFLEPGGKPHCSIPGNGAELSLGLIWLSKPVCNAVEDFRERCSAPLPGSHGWYPHPDASFARMQHPRGRDG